MKKKQNSKPLIPLTQPLLLSSINPWGVTRAGLLLHTPPHLQTVAFTAWAAHIAFCFPLPSLVSAQGSFCVLPAFCDCDIFEESKPILL